MSERTRIKSEATITVSVDVKEIIDSIVADLEDQGYHVYYHDEVDDVECEINFTVYGRRDFYPGSRWLSNGDPGDPDEEDIEYVEPDMNRLDKPYCSLELEVSDDWEEDD